MADEYLEQAIISDIKEFIKNNYQPVEDKPGYVWFDKKLISSDKEDRIFWIICLISAISMIVGGVLIVYGIMH